MQRKTTPLYKSELFTPSYQSDKTPKECEAGEIIAKRPSSFLNNFFSIFAACSNEEEMDNEKESLITLTQVIVQK